CKRLDGTPPDAQVWNEVVPQFLNTAKVATRCGASLAVLAAQVDEYPAEVREAISAGVGNGIEHLLLDKSDLEVGHRRIQDRGHERWLWFDDLLPVLFPDPLREPADKPRTINMGWGMYTHRGQREP
ncbi:MAG TPA: hypothetical protein VH120_13140, partial [Gemmataceae bacterium]|nr:hypothetical protein [Gemmataceae bacterium]